MGPASRQLPNFNYKMPICQPSITVDFATDGKYKIRSSLAQDSDPFLLHKTTKHFKVTVYKQTITNRQIPAIMELYPTACYTPSVYSRDTDGNSVAPVDVPNDAPQEPKTMELYPTACYSRNTDGNSVEEPKTTWDIKTPLSLHLTFAMKTAIEWLATTRGAFIALYGLNVVCWGAMLFFLLCNAIPAMCSKTPEGCNDINSPRNRWIEIDQQILNVLFCMTAFGLAPSRCMDVFHLLQYHGMFNQNMFDKHFAIRYLAGSFNSWYRLQGSDDWQLDDRRSLQLYLIDRSVPLPYSKHLQVPVSGTRAPATAP